MLRQRYCRPGFANTQNVRRNINHHDMDRLSKIIGDSLVQIVLNLYERLHQLDASRALHETKEKIDALLIPGSLDQRTFKTLSEVSDQCFNSWAPLCEMAVFAYRDIQNYILPSLSQLLSPEDLSEVKSKIEDKNWKIYDFNSLQHLPSRRTGREVDDDYDKSDYDDEDDDNITEDYSYEDGPYCHACQQSPCLCSDPERTSTVWG